MKQIPVLVLLVGLSGCASSRESAISASVSLMYEPKSPMESEAFARFFRRAEVSWSRALRQEKVFDEESELVLILVPSAPSRLAVREIESASQNLSRAAGRAAVRAISDATNDFDFPSSVYADFVKMGEVRVVFKNRKKGAD